MLSRLIVSDNILTTDPYFNNVSLLLRGNGSNGNQSFIDLSNFKNTLTANGNVQNVTTVRKNGVGSIYFDGSGDYLTIPAAPHLDFRETAFTIEAWIYPLPLVHGDGGCILTNRPMWGGGAYNVQIYFGLTNDYNPPWYRLYFGMGDGNTYLCSFWTPNAIPLYSWSHVCVVIDLSYVRLYVNGVLENSRAWNNVILKSSYNQSTCHIGYGAYNSQYFSGYIDDLRVTKGIARYTSNNFIPTTTPFPY